VNHKRVQRLWREEGLQRPTPRKQKRARPADGSVRRHRPEHPHQVWAMDFQFDATADGRRLKFLNVIEEHSRFCLAIRVGRRCKAKDVVAVLEELTIVYLPGVNYVGGSRQLRRRVPPPPPAMAGGGPRVGWRVIDAWSGRRISPCQSLPRAVPVCGGSSRH